MTRRDFDERDIHMALDGELPQEERAGFHAWLDANPEMKARSQRFEADRSRLRETFAGVLDEPVPDSLAGAVTGEAKKSSVAAPRWRMAAAAVLLLAIGAGGGYLAGMAGLGLEGQAEDQLAEEAIAAHTVYAAEQRHAVEVGANDRDHLLGWLSNRLGLTLIAPDLSAEGFELVGGRLLPAGQTTAAHLLYEDAKGNRISIYVTPEGKGKAKGVYKDEKGTASAVYWLDDGWGCAVVGTLPRDQMLDIGRNAYRQLLAGAGMT
ncbi:MAG TPA: anti-sigma factor [Rhizobiaceae bacterium]